MESLGPLFINHYNREHYKMEVSVLDSEQKALICSNCGEPFDFTEGFLSRQLDIDEATYYCSSNCYEQSLQDFSH